jgi:hypothetical protein
MKSLHESILADMESTLKQGDIDVQKQLVLEFLNENYTCKYGEYKISNKPDKQGKLVVSCDGEVVLKHGSELTQLTNDLFVFKKVTKFSCSNASQLITLENGPEECSSFDCSSCNKLKSLKFSPKKLMSLKCSLCYSLISLEGCSRLVRNIDCNSCISLPSLAGIPRRLNTLDISYCNALKKENLKSLPKAVGVCYCNGCSYSTDEIIKYTKVSLLN